MSESIYVPRGVDVPPLDSDKMWQFKPLHEIKIGSLLVGGDVYGTCFENNLFETHRLMIPPKVKGKVTFIAPEGEYGIHEEVIELEFNGKLTKYQMSHWWPVRQPRPVSEKLAGNVPLLTGQRVLDALFPSVLGGTCSIPGAFGCGKTCISQALSKYSNS